MINLRKKITRFALIALYTFIVLNKMSVVGFSKISYVSENMEVEWWIETEIFPKQEISKNDILLFIYDNFVEDNREFIVSWHFFRENNALRFRIESKNKLNRDITAQNFARFLDEVDYIENYFFARHGEKITNFDEGYQGERDQYKRMWPYQKKIWEWGAEMTVAAIKEIEETGENEPPREYQLTRIYHLLALQLSPRFDIWYCFQPDNPGGSLVILSLIASFVLGALFAGLLNLLRARR